ncbi:MAG: hypothetical protein WCD51_01605 [Anaerolineae bacterium]
MTDRRRQLVVAFLIYLGFTLLMLTANVVNYIGEREGALETLEPIASMILGFVAIPVFAIALPLWLGRRWKLEYSFWPRHKNWLMGVAVVSLYLCLTQQQSGLQLMSQGIGTADFLVHFVSTMLFHVSYYPLFAVLLLPVLRRNFGLTAGLVVTAALFALYHLAGFYYFPAGLTLRLQVLLFASFAASLLLYLWTENLILVAMAHNVGGSVGLAVNGTLFNQVDELLVVTVLLMAGLLAYMIVFEVRHRTRVHRDGWWLSVQTENQAC